VCVFVDMHDALHWSLFLFLPSHHPSHFSHHIPPSLHHNRIIKGRQAAGATMVKAGGKESVHSGSMLDVYLLLLRVCLLPRSPLLLLLQRFPSVYK